MLNSLASNLKFNIRKVLQTRLLMLFLEGKMLNYYLCYLIMVKWDFMIRFRSVRVKT